MKKQAKESNAEGFGTAEQDGQRPGGGLPGEAMHERDGWSEEEGDEQLFVAMREPGEQFTGQFIKHLKKGDHGLKHAGLLFAEYPGGALRVVRADWSLGEKIAEKEREDEQFFARNLMRATLSQIVPKGDNTVKLYVYQFKPIPEGFAPRWNEQFPNPIK